MAEEFQVSINKIFPVILVVILFLGTLPISQLARASGGAVVDTDTNTEYFDETIYHESEQPLFSSDKKLLTVPSMGQADWALCTAIQAAQAVATNSITWDCDDLDGDGWFQFDDDGHFLEHDRYSMNIYLVYQYKIEYYGDLTIKTTTSWDYNTPPQTITEIIDSNENFEVSAKASLRLKINRNYVGPDGDQNIHRNTLDFDIPVMNPITDIDGDGTHVNFKGTKYYKWDNYVEFVTESDENNMLGQNHDLDGAITLFEIDLLGLAANILQGPQLALLKAFNHFISITFEINLNLKVDMKNYVQVLLGMNSVSSIRSSYQSDSSRSGYGCFLSSTGSCTKMVTGSGTQMNGVLGFYHSISTEESYSADIVIDHADSWDARLIWGWFTDGNPKVYPLSSGNFATSSSGNQLTLSSSSFPIDSSNSYILTTPPNNKPEITITDGTTEISTLSANLGSSSSITVYTYDGDGDVLTGRVAWGDGSYTELNSNSPQTVSHTYSNTGIFHIGVEVSDGKDFSYGAPLRAIVTPEFSALTEILLSTVDNVIDEGDTMQFSLDSTTSETTTEYIFDDGQGNNERLQPSSGQLSSLTKNIIYQSPGEFFPNLQAFDSTGNLIGYHDLKIRVLPDFGNGTYDITQFEILGDGILVVIDDDGNQLYTDERSEHYENSNVSSDALINAVSKVATILNKSVEFFIVGDTDLDGTVDTQGSNGPGLKILSQYSTVIWTTGSDYIPLTEFDESVLTTYVRSKGSLVLFSQDYLYGVNSTQNQWYQGTFAYDILGLGSSIQDIGEPSANYVSNNEAPFYGLGEIELSELTSNSYQDDLSNLETSYLWPEFQDFESSSIHGAKSRFINPQTTPFTDMGTGTINWRTWNYWQRDCSASTFGSCSFKSAPANDNNAKTMYADVYNLNVATQLQFNYYVSSEATYDILKFSVNGQEVQRWSGTSMTQWGTFSHTLSPGSHSLEWAYVKDGSGSSGSDAAWIDAVYLCCNTVSTERLLVNEIMQIGDSNYGLKHRALTDGDNDGQADTFADIFFFAIDPVQIDKKYDLENMILNLIDTSVNRNVIPWTPDGGIETPEKANWLFMDDDSFTPSNWGGADQCGVQWYNIRLFGGQNIEVNMELPSSRSDVYDNYDVSDLTIFDLEGNQVTGSIVSGDHWKLNYTASETGTYQLRVNMTLTGSNQSTNGAILPVYRLLVTSQLDNFRPELVLDGVSINDNLTPKNWAGAQDYSSTTFELGLLQTNTHYGITLDSNDESSSHSLRYSIVDNDTGQIYVTDLFTLSSSKNHTILFELPSAVNVNLIIENIGDYEHPLLGTFGYEVNFWSILPPDASDQSNGIFKLTENAKQTFWISSILDQSDSFAVDSSWDENMIIEFESDFADIDAYAIVQCPNQEVVNHSLFSGVIEIGCDEPFSEVTVEIFTNEIYLPYSLQYLNVDSENKVQSEQPLFGINQQPGTFDSWSLPYISEGRILSLVTNQSGFAVFYDRMGLEINSVDLNSEFILIPDNAARFDIENSGEYKFIIFEPDKQDIWIEQPEIVTLGDVLTIGIEVNQSFDFTSKMSQERLDHLWIISAPNLTLSLASEYSSVQLLDQTTSDKSIGSKLHSSLYSNYSIDTNSLPIGTNQFFFESSSSWSENLQFDVQVTLFDKINTVPVISGPTNLEFNSSELSGVWSYQILDADEESMVISVLNSVPGLIIDKTSIDSSGVVEVQWDFSNLQQENYTFILVVEDEESIIQHITNLRITYEEILVDDIFGCSNETAVNYNPLVTIDDDTCQYDDDDVIDTTNTTDTGDNSTNQPDQSEKPSEGSGDSSKAGSTLEPVLIFSIIGGVVLLLLATLVFSSRSSKSDRDRQSNFDNSQHGFDDLLNQKDPLVGLSNMPPNPPLTQANLSTEPAYTNTNPSQNLEPSAIPSRVESYLQLKGGGEYSLDERGTVYTDPSGYEWVQLGDGSFVRLN